MTKKENRLKSGRTFQYKGRVPTLTASAVVLFCGLGFEPALASYYDHDSGPWAFFPIAETGSVDVPPGRTTAVSNFRYTCYEDTRGGSWYEHSCYKPIRWDGDHRSESGQNKQEITCQAVSGTESKNFPFNGTAQTIDAWTLSAKRGGGFTTDGELDTKRLLSIFEIRSSDNFYSEVRFSAGYTTDTPGVVVKPLVVTCTTALPSWVSVNNPGNAPLVRTFNPQASAEFSASRISAATVEHRAKDEGIHIYKLDFGKTVWSRSRTIKHTFDFAASGCGLDSAWSSLHFDEAIPWNKTGANYNDFNPGNTLNLQGTKTVDPKFAYFRLRAKKSAGGAYNCSVTLTQSVN